MARLNKQVTLLATTVKQPFAKAHFLRHAACNLDAIQRIEVINTVASILAKKFAGQQILSITLIMFTKNSVKPNISQQSAPWLARRAPSVRPV